MGAIAIACAGKTERRQASTSARAPETVDADPGPASVDDTAVVEPTWDWRDHHGVREAQPPYEAVEYFADLALSDYLEGNVCDPTSADPDPRWPTIARKCGAKRAGSHYERCCEARSDPARRLVWHLGYRLASDAGSVHPAKTRQRRRRTQILARLSRRGLRGKPDPERGSVRVRATYDRIAPILVSPLVGTVGVTCADDDGICDCRRTKDECKKTPFCRLAACQRIDTDAECRFETSYAGCMQVTAAKCGAPASVLDGRERVWRCPEQCAPTGWPRVPEAPAHRRYPWCEARPEDPVSEGACNGMPCIKVRY